VVWKSSVKVVMSSTEAIQRAVVPALQMEIPTAVAAASSPDSSVGTRTSRQTWIWL
jgi:hypothetical protein